MYSIKFRMFAVRENEIALRKLSSATVHVCGCTVCASQSEHCSWV